MRRLLTAGAVIGALAVAVLAAGPARAHSPLLSAAPGPGDTVAPGVEVVALNFTALRAGEPATVTVTGPGETPILTGPGVVAGIATICATVRPLTAGIHAISYSATSDDGDPVEGKYFFEVVAGATAVTTPDSCRQTALPAPGTTLAAARVAGTTKPAGDGVRTVAQFAVAALALAGIGWWLTHRLRRRTP